MYQKILSNCDFTWLSRKRKRTTSRHVSNQMSRGISKEEKPEKKATLIEEEEAEIGSVSDVM